MRIIFERVAFGTFATITCFLVISTVSAYENGEAGKATVGGTITFKGTLPPPILDPFDKHPNAKYCSRFDNDGNGYRIHNDIAVNNGRLRDIVVYIQNITKGKPFVFHGTDVKAHGCRFLVQGGPSTFVGVVVKGQEIRILNEDADLDDPLSKDGLLHTPHAYEVKDQRNATIFDYPLPSKGEVLTRKVILRKEGSFVKLEADNHNFMYAYFYPVENPYYAIVGPEGTYSIDQVPAGKYKIIAWHPILGTQEKEIEVGTDGKVQADFEFSK